MADEQKSTPGSVPAFFQEWMDQLRTAAGHVGGVRPGSPAPGSMPGLPGALSAAQMKSITDSIAAQRRSIEALQAQLAAFDEQLAVLENMLGPLAKWSGTWADLEQRFLNMGRRPEHEG